MGQLCKDCGKRMNGRKSRCSTCYKKWYRVNNPEKYLAQRERARKAKRARGLCIYCNKRERTTTLYCTECRELNNGKLRDARQDARQMVIAHYGGKCDCCGESEFGFLTIDHISGGGNAHRRAIGGSNRVYQWLIQQGYPAGYRVLCYNCNCAIGVLGVCPHQSSHTSP